MKNLTNTIAVLTLTFGAATAASATSISASDSSSFTNVCMAAASGNSVRLKHAIRDTGYSFNHVTESVKCNGLPINEFVSKYSKSPESINGILSNGRKGNVSIIDVPTK